jgi:hypothetical protein
MFDPHGSKRVTCSLDVGVKPIVSSVVLVGMGIKDELTLISVTIGGILVIAVTVFF